MTEIDGKRIGTLNDRFRTQQDFSLGRWVISAGVNALGTVFVQRVCRAVQQFTDFNRDNDPYGEHDMGRIEIDGESVLWKIDYYADQKLDAGSEDPSDPKRSYRVLTVMLGIEY